MVLGEEDKHFTQMRRGALEFCVMALLRNGDRYGFDVTRLLSENPGLATSEGTIYPLLARLRSDGLVTTYWEESPEGPPRRYYHLTEGGSIALDTFTLQWNVFSNSVNKLLKEGS
jgi:PadR family transcriptional regulator PadR